MKKIISLLTTIAQSKTSLFIFVTQVAGCCARACIISWSSSNIIRGWGSEYLGLIDLWHQNCCNTSRYTIPSMVLSWKSWSSTCRSYSVHKNVQFRATTNFWFFYDLCEFSLPQTLQLCKTLATQVKSQLVRKDYVIQEIFILLYSI